MSHEMAPGDRDELAKLLATRIDDQLLGLPHEELEELLGELTPTEEQLAEMLRGMTGKQ